MKSTCCDTRATDSIIKSGQKDTEASILFEIHVSKTRFKQINENLRLNVYASMFSGDLQYFIPLASKITEKNGSFYLSVFQILL